MVNELSEYFSKDLIANNLRKDDMKLTTQTMQTRFWITISSLLGNDEFA